MSGLRRRLALLSALAGTLVAVAAPAASAAAAPPAPRVVTPVLDGRAAAPVALTPAPTGLPGPAPVLTDWWW